MAHDFMELDFKNNHWSSYGLCSEADPEIFHSNEKRHIEEAKRVCGGCIVKDECLKEAIENGYEYGVWGGLDSDQRDALKSVKNIGKLASR